MKAKWILGKVASNIVAMGSLMVLSACGQTDPNNAQGTTGQMPTVSTSPVTAPIATNSPAARSPTGTTQIPTVAASPMTEAPIPTNSPIAPSPPGTTQNKTLGELVESAASSGSFKTLTQAIQAADLTKNLTTEGPYTVFAPTDEAFTALPKGTVENLLKPENKQKLVKLLAYHVMPGQVTSSQLPSGKVETMEGNPVTLKVNTTSSTVMVNGAKVIQADIPARNGVVHVIDKVLLPPGF